MIVISGKWKISKFKKVLRAIASANQVYSDKKGYAVFIAKDNWLIVKNKEDGIKNVFYIPKEFFEKYEPSNRKFKLLLSDLIGLINKRTNKIVITDDSKVRFYDFSGKLQYETVFEELEKKEKKRFKVWEWYPDFVFNSSCSLELAKWL